MIIIGLIVVVTYAVFMLFSGVVIEAVSPLFDKPATRRYVNTNQSVQEKSSSTGWIIAVVSGVILVLLIAVAPKGDQRVEARIKLLLEKGKCGPNYALCMEQVRALAEKQIREEK